MLASDISLKMPEGIFNLRACAIIADAGEILMVQNEGSDYYYTVGGRVRFGESAKEAVVREAFEETGMRLEAERLAYVHESFFVFEGNGQTYHELSMFFFMKPVPGMRERLSEAFDEPYGKVTFHWLPVDGLKDLRLFPEFFKTELLNPSEGVKYFITK